MSFPSPPVPPPSTEGFFVFFFFFLFSPAFSLPPFLSCSSSSPFPRAPLGFSPCDQPRKADKKTPLAKTGDEAARKRGKTDQNAEPFKSSPMSSGRPNIRFMFCTA